MSGMTQLCDEPMRRRLRRCGVVARNGLGGVLDGWWVPLWTVELARMMPSDSDLERAIGWVLNTRRGGNPKASVYPRERLEDVRDSSPRLEAIRHSYMYGAIGSVRSLIWNTNPGQVQT